MIDDDFNKCITDLVLLRIQNFQASAELLNLIIDPMCYDSARFEIIRNGKISLQQIEDLIALRDFYNADCERRCLKELIVNQISHSGHIPENVWQFFEGRTHVEMISEVCSHIATWDHNQALSIVNSQEHRLTPEDYEQILLEIIQKVALWDIDTACGIVGSIKNSQNQDMAYFWIINSLSLQALDISYDEELYVARALQIARLMNHMIDTNKIPLSHWVKRIACLNLAIATISKDPDQARRYAETALKVEVVSSSTELIWKIIVGPFAKMQLAPQFNHSSFNNLKVTLLNRLAESYASSDRLLEGLSLLALFTDKSEQFIYLNAILDAIGKRTINLPIE